MLHKGTWTFVLKTYLLTLEVDFIQQVVGIHIGTNCLPFLNDKYNTLSNQYNQVSRIVFNAYENRQIIDMKRGHDIVRCRPMHSTHPIKFSHVKI